jgi:polyhydroxybutyrate depolymerase
VDAGFSDHCLNLGQGDRIYRVYKPSSLSSASKAKAVVILLHGGGGSGIEDASIPTSNALGVFTAVADREQILVVYPQGTLDSEGKTGWNDCRADDQSKSGADDVGFLSELITQMKSAWSIESSRVFMGGTSNGAMMTYRFVMERSNLVAAVATSSGNIAAKPAPGRCQSGPERPVPILMTHGSADPVVPYEGGFVACFGDKSGCDRGAVLSTQETINFWLGVHGLQGSTPVTRTVDTSQDDAGPAIESRYTARTATSGAAALRPKLISWDLKGAGHSPPSMTLDKGNKLVGNQNKDIEFAEEAWRFFKAHL